MSATGTTWQPPVKRTAAEKAALIPEILATYARVRYLMARHDLPTVVARLRDAPRKDWDPGYSAYRSGTQLGWAVTRTLKVLPTDNRCLMQSLVLTRLVARRGLDSELIVAVKTDPEFLAHAWVEYESRPLLDPGESDFRRILVV